MKSRWRRAKCSFATNDERGKYLSRTVPRTAGRFRITFVWSVYVNAPLCRGFDSCDNGLAKWLRDTMRNRPSRIWEMSHIPLWNFITRFYASMKCNATVINRDYATHLFSPFALRYCCFLKSKCYRTIISRSAITARRTDMTKCTLRPWSAIAI